MLDLSVLKFQQFLSGGGGIGVEIFLKFLNLTYFLHFRIVYNLLKFNCSSSKPPPPHGSNYAKIHVIETHELYFIIILICWGAVIINDVGGRGAVEDILQLLINFSRPISRLITNIKKLNIFITFILLYMREQVYVCHFIMLNNDLF